MFKDLLKNIETKIDKVMNFNKLSFATSTLKDSDTVVEYSTKVGGDAVMATSNGSQPLSDGVHELSNGVKLTVKEGKIESIEKPEVKEESFSKEDEKVEKAVEEVENADDKKEEDEVEISLEAETGVTDEEVEQLVDGVTNGDKEAIEALKAEVEQIKKVLDERFEVLSALNQDFMQVLKTTVRPENFNKVEEKQDKWLAMARATKK